MALNPLLLFFKLWWHADYFPTLKMGVADFLFELWSSEAKMNCVFFTCSLVGMVTYYVKIMSKPSSQIISLSNSTYHIMSLKWYYHSIELQWLQTVGTVVNHLIISLTSCTDTVSLLASARRAYLLPSACSDTKYQGMFVASVAGAGLKVMPVYSSNHTGVKDFSVIADTRFLSVGLVLTQGIHEGIFF